MATWFPSIVSKESEFSRRRQSGKQLVSTRCLLSSRGSSTARLMDVAWDHRIKRMCGRVTWRERRLLK